MLTNPARLAALLSAAGKGMTVDDDGLPLTKLMTVLPELKSVDPVGLSLPVGPPVHPRHGCRWIRSRARRSSPR
ncbi:hypothetical protein NKG94_35075 [Micromonospora sp. M12]